jgi:hypothetical protein
MLWGHRRDAQGYAQALRAVDAWIPDGAGADAPRRRAFYYRQPRHRPHPRMRAAAGVGVVAARRCRPWERAPPLPTWASQSPPLLVLARWLRELALQERLAYVPRSKRA